ncbi:MAG: hypothetical protein ABFC67_07475 [Mizugakiibacter sp.]|uniref:hypothetical protein n=1 Tax=Mizugakiibacter sp. TaxID=1972610 RepID=UPI00320C7263
MSQALTKLSSLVPRLQAIKKANGYNTDAGTTVLFGPIPRSDADALPIIRLHWPSADPESALVNVPHNKVRVNFVVEGEGACAPVDFLTSCDAIASDIKRAVFGDIERNLQGLAMDVRFDGQEFTVPDPGTAAYLVRIAGSFTFVDHFNAP